MLYSVVFKQSFLTHNPKIHMPNLIFNGADANGFFGQFGGRFVPPELEKPLQNLEKAYNEAIKDPLFMAEYEQLLHHFVGRPTPIYHAKRLSEKLGGAQIYLKREDLCHTGAHKLNNALGQSLLAKRMGLKRVIAETGAGQHGVATATACAMLGLKCVIFMGEVDMHRQSLNVYRMRLLGAEVREATSGSRTLKDAVNEALIEWTQTFKHTFYVLGSAVGPHPYPEMVRTFQSVIGREARSQMLELEGRLPDSLVACVGGGSNAIGLFSAFLNDKSVQVFGVEAGGTDIKTIGKHATRFIPEAVIRTMHGMNSYVLVDKHGEPTFTHSISAGLDYVSVGPEHAYLHDVKRATYSHASDTEVIEAFQMLSRVEGILPALESSHAVAWAIKHAKDFSPEHIMLVNLSGRGDKDVDQLRNVIPNINDTHII